MDGLIQRELTLRRLASRLAEGHPLGKQDLGNPSPCLLSLAEVQEDLGEADRSLFGGLSRDFALFRRRVGQTLKAVVLVPVGYSGLSWAHAFPDWDISLLGIGRHRFFLFHSAAALYLLKRAHQAYLSRQGQEGGFLHRWERQVFGCFVGSAAVGLGVHLLVDVVQPKAVVFPWFGSLAKGTLVDDDLWLLGNGLWCFKVAREVFVLAFGRDLEETRAVVARDYIGPLTGQAPQEG